MSGRPQYEPGFVYLAQWGNLYKIGMARNVRKRVRELGYDYPGVELIHHFASDSMWRDETKLHDRFAACRVQGEWFALTEDDVTWILMQ